MYVFLNVRGIVFILPFQIRVVCDSDNSSRKTLPPSRNAGLSSLRSSIASSTRGMHSMQAGANFRCMVKTEKEREVDQYNNYI